MHGKVDLYGGSSSRYGYVKVCIHGTWVKMCGHDNTVLNNDLGTIICSEVGFSPFG